MRSITDQAMVVANFQVWVMVFKISHPGDSVDKGHGLIKVFEAEIARNEFVVGTELPVVQFSHELGGIYSIERADAAFTGDAVFLVYSGHESFLDVWKSIALCWGLAKEGSFNSLVRDPRGIANFVILAQECQIMQLMPTLAKKYNPGRRVSLFSRGACKHKKNDTRKGL